MLNLCTIGTSQISRTFIEATLHVDEVSVYAVYSRDQRKADTLATDFHITKIYTDLESMLKDKRINGVYIASPNALHFDQVMACMKWQKHVICEKPIFTRIADYYTAYEEADRQGVYLFEAMKNLHTPNFLELKDALSLVGKVRSAYLHRVRYSSKYDKFLEGDLPNVFLQKMEGGALRDLGVYPLSLMLALFDIPNASHYHSVKLSSGVDGTGTLILDYNDFIGVIMCSKISTSYNAGEIHGELGTLIIDNPSPINTITFVPNHNGVPSHMQVSETMPTMSYQIQTFKNIVESEDDKSYHYYRNISEKVVWMIEEHGFGIGTKGR